MNLSKNNRFLFVLSSYFENIFFAHFSVFLRWQEINTDLVREAAGVNVTSKEI